MKNATNPVIPAVVGVLANNSGGVGGYGKIIT